MQRSMLISKIKSIITDRLTNVYRVANSLTVLGCRKIEGCLCRVPAHFYNQVWEVLVRCPGGIVVNGRELPQQPTVSSMTRSELTFALLVESLLHHIQLPEYRQIIVEASDFNINRYHPFSFSYFAVYYIYILLLLLLLFVSI